MFLGKLFCPEYLVKASISDGGHGYLFCLRCKIFLSDFDDTRRTWVTGETVSEAKRHDNQLMELIAAKHTTCYRCSIGKNDPVEP